MKPEELKTILATAATKKAGKLRLSCAKAFALSVRHNLSLKIIGAACNKNGIKIVSCQLGCFK